MVGGPLAGASVAKTATLLGVSGTAVSKVLTAYTIMGRHHQLRGIVIETQN
jgi:predicted transcriptional regulator